MAVPISVYIPTPYREFTGGRAQVELEAQTVGELLRLLAERYPGIGERIFQDGKLAEHVNVYVNQEEIRSLRGEDTPLRDGDEVALIPAMAGGQEVAAGPVLTEEQLERYSRHILLPEVGLEGQRRLLRAKVLIVGAGGLGSPAAIYLAAAGVGTLGIVDGDRVDLSNLQRQILHFTHDVGRPKTQSARRHLEDLNPDVRVIEHRTVLTSANALDIIKDYDVVVNGSDNFPTRYLVNDACVMLRKPLVDASILRFEAQATVFLPGRGCYRCLYPAPPPPGSVPSCAEAGIFGAMAGHIGTLQAMEAIKIILGIGDTLANRLLIFDALAVRYREVRWRRNPDCPVCGDRPTITRLIDYEQFCGVPAPRAAVSADGHGTAAPTPSATAAVAAAEPVRRLTVDELLAREDPDVTVDEAAELIRSGQVDVIDVRRPQDYAKVHIPQARLLPLRELPERLDEIDPERPTIVVCNVGQTSAQAVAFLRQAGYRRVYNLKGGTMAWLNRQLPVVQGDGHDG